MYTLNCKDLDPAGACDFVVTGETKEEVLKKVQEHAATAHADKMAGMTPDDQVMMGKKIEELLAAQDTM